MKNLYKQYAQPAKPAGSITAANRQRRNIGMNQSLEMENISGHSSMVGSIVPEPAHQRQRNQGRG
jgi:hypothetical protein